MQKNSVPYWIKKSLGTAIIRVFEFMIKIADGNRDFYDAHDFAFSHVLSNHWEEIRKEYRAVATTTIIPPIQEVSIEQEQLTRDQGWRAYLLTVYGYDLNTHLNRCPATTECLRMIPDMTSALFSVLEPGKQLPAHRGPYKGVLRCHLALIVPDENLCGIKLNGKLRHWREGECMIFDDTFIHSAYNQSDAPRVVLFVDFLRPLPFPLNYINLIIFNLIARSEFITEVLDRSHRLDGSTFTKRKLKSGFRFPQAKHVNP